MFITLKNLIIVDQATGKISHSKLWANVASLLLCIAFWSKMTDLDAWMIFGGLFLSNHLVTRYINGKNGNNISTENSP